MPRVLCTTTAVRAEGIAEYLRLNGVMVRVAHHSADAVYGSGQQTMVVVEERQFDDARRLLKQMEAEPVAIEGSLEEAARPDLSRLDPALRPPCPACGRLLPLDATLEACPDCRAAVDVAEQIVLAHGSDVLAPCYPDDAEPIPEDVLISAKLACAACGYWLEGLPAEGPCPECGMQYRKSQIVRG